MFDLGCTTPLESIYLLLLLLLSLLIIDIHSGNWSFWRFVWNDEVLGFARVFPVLIIDNSVQEIHICKALTLLLSGFNGNRMDDGKLLSCLVGCFGSL